MSPMRFYLLFDVIGNASQQLASIGSQFLNLGAASQASAIGLNRTHGAMIAMIHGMYQLSAAGDLIEGWGTRFLGTLYSLTHGVFETATAFETLRERVNFAYAANATEIWKNLSDYAVESVYSFNEVADTVGGLGTAIQGLDQQFINMSGRFLGRTGEMENAFQVIGDAAAGTGRTYQWIGYEIQQMMSGVYRGAHQTLHLTHEETDEIKHAVSTMTDRAAQFNVIMEVLARHYGGATAQLTGTMRFLAMQIPDIIQTLQDRIGHDGLEVLKGALGDIVLRMRALVQDEEFIRSMASVFRMMAEAVAEVARWTVTAADHIRRFIAENPGLIRFGVALGVIGSALMVIGGTLLSVTAGLAVFIASVSMAGTAILTAFGWSIGLITAFGAGIMGLVAFSVLLREAFDRNLGGIATKFEHFGLIVEALGQAFRNWNGDLTAITMEMANKLENAGLLGFFVNLVSWIARAREWLTGLWAGIRDGLASVNWNGITTGLESIERVLGSIGVHLGLMQPAAATSFETMEDRGRSFGHTLNQVIVPGLNLLVAGFQAAAWAVENILVPALTFFYHIGTMVLENWSGIKGIVLAVALVMAPIPTLIFMLLNATNGWGTALNNVSSTFSVLLSIGERMWDIALRIGEAFAAIPDLLGMSSVLSSIGGMIPSGSGPAHSGWNPYAMGVPAYVQTGGGSADTTPMQVSVQGGRVESSGGRQGVDSSELAQAFANAMRQLRDEEGRGHGHHREGSRSTIVIDGQPVASVVNQVAEEGEARRGAAFPGRRR